MAAITVIGAGYVGLVTSACFASIGHDVRCVEPDASRLSSIRDGRLPVREPGLNDLVRKTSAQGSLLFTGRVEESLGGSAYAFVAVPTPAASDGSPDLGAVMSVTDQLRRHADDGTVVVLKSTVPVGTGDIVASALDHRLPVVSNPEFLREGSAVQDFLKPDRIVIGAEDPAAGASVATLYEGVTAPVISIDRRSAELAKYASNAYLAVRLSFANEMARICGATGADVDSIMRVLASDHRIGPHYLKTGIGWGGGCLPKDVAALKHTGLSANVEPHMLRAAQAANDAQTEFLVSTLNDQLGGLDNRLIGMLGTAFKAGTDDVRESPALTVARKLRDAGARVRVHDPLAQENTSRVAPELEFADNIGMLAAGTDAVILSTDWPEYRSIDWRMIAGLMHGDFVFDARNALDAGEVISAGLRYASYGRLIQSQ